MFCSKCGKEIKEGAAFCGYCGAAVVEQKAAPDPVTVSAKSAKHKVGIAAAAVVIVVSVIAGGLFWAAGKGESEQTEEEKEQSEEENEQNEGEKEQNEGEEVTDNNVTDNTEENLDKSVQDDDKEEEQVREWAQAYYDYITNNLLSEWSSKGLSTDTLMADLIYVDADNIPEVFICSDEVRSPACLLTYFGDQVTGYWLDIANEYIPYGNLFRSGGGGMMGDVYETIYSLNDGKLQEIAHGAYVEREDGEVQYYSWNDEPCDTKEQYYTYLNDLYDTSQSINLYQSYEMGGIDEITNTLAGLLSESASETEKETSNEAEKSGYIVRETIYGQGWYGSSRRVNEYDVNGNVLKEITYTQDGEAWNVDRWTEYEYTLEGNLAKRTYYNAYDNKNVFHEEGIIKSWEEIEYDAFGNKVSSLSYDSINKNITMKAEYHNEYDTLGRLVKMTPYYDYGDGYQSDGYREEYEYDGSGNMTKIIVYGIDFGGNEVILNINEYDASGNIIKRFDSLYEYDEYGNCIKITSFNEDGSIKELTDCYYEYDLSGNLIKGTAYDQAGSAVWWTESEYDIQGRIVKKTENFANGDCNKYEYEYPF